MRDEGTDQSSDQQPPAQTLEVAVFPLTRITLFPKTSKPLNIFEPRYLEMVRDAVDRGGLVALAFAEPLSPRATDAGALGQVRAIAGVGRVSIVSKRPDATMLVLLEGIGKVRLLRDVTAGQPYIVAQAAWQQEQTELAQQNLFILNRLMKALTKWLELHVADPSARTAFLQRLVSAEEKINAICSLMVLESDAQQALLEADSLDERIAHLAMALEVDGLVQ